MDISEKIMLLQKDIIQIFLIELGRAEFPEESLEWDKMHLR